MTGLTILTDEETYVIYEKLNALEIILSIIPLILVFLGGMIGAICGVLASFAIVTVIRSTKNIWISILTSLVASAAAFGVYLILAIYILQITY